MYFDYAATTPLHPDVQNAMINALAIFGNPSAIHTEGRKARAIIDECHSVIAAYVNVKPDEVIVCSSGTEANNIAIHSVCTHWLNTHKTPGRIITSPLEHKAVSAILTEYANHDWQIDTVAVQDNGVIDIVHLQSLLQTGATTLVSIQWVNSETGLIQPVEDIAKLCREYTVPYHCDAMQGVPHLALPTILPDLWSFAPHKMYGPKGVGVLIANKSLPLIPLVRGGGQEYGVRSGTENMVGCAGTLTAMQLLKTERTKREEYNQMCKDRILSALSKCTNWQYTMENSPTISSTIHLLHKHTLGEDLLMKADLQQIYLSTGSACSIGASEPSSALIAFGFSTEQAKRAIRISFGAYTTIDEVDQLVDWLAQQ
jgi:cysteine desulfurase